MGNILQGNSLEVLKGISDNSIDCCVTSPPYYALRDYGTGHWEGGDPNCPHYRTSKYSENTATGHKAMMESGNAVGDSIYKRVCPICGAVRVDEQIGLEETPEEYIQKLVELFHEVRRVLKPEGTLWLNIGDSYCGSGSRGYDFTETFTDASKVQQESKGTIDLHNVHKLVGNTNGIKNKDLIGIPWMLAFALRSDGWYLRQDIIWAKTNCMPESVTDRCTKSHEYIFLLSKNPKYYFDNNSIKTHCTTTTTTRAKYKLKTKRPDDMNGHIDTEKMGDRFAPKDGANKRDVWRVSCSSYKGAHFATFPEELVRPCIRAGCPLGGTVLDPFFGSGTTGAVAVQEGRDYLGIELNPEYIKLADERLSEQQVRLPI